MLFSVQDRLIQMCDAPSLRDIVLEKLQKFLRSFSCDIVSPGTERNQKLSTLIKWHISMHHGTDSKCTDTCQLYSIFLLNILYQIAVASLQTVSDIIQRVGPYTVFVAVLPLIASGCNRIIFVIYQNRFDPGRSELYSKCCFVI